MSGKITGFLREYILFLSVILTVLGVILMFIGITPIWFSDIPESLFNLAEDSQGWLYYLLALGFVSLIAGIIYLYNYIKNRKFILDELKTNKRSELQKRHLELKKTTKKMPSKYQKMLKEKEKELRL